MKSILLFVGKQEKILRAQTGYSHHTTYSYNYKDNGNNLVIPTPLHPNPNSNQLNPNPYPDPNPSRVPASCINHNAQVIWATICDMALLPP